MIFAPLLIDIILLPPRFEIVVVNIRLYFTIGMQFPKGSGPVARTMPGQPNTGVPPLHPIGESLPPKKEFTQMQKARLPQNEEKLPAGYFMKFGMSYPRFFDLLILELSKTSENIS